MNKENRSSPNDCDHAVRVVQREEVRKAEQLAELRARIDQQLASLNAPSARQAMNAFMDEPFDLGGRLRPEDAS